MIPYLTQIARACEEIAQEIRIIPQIAQDVRTIMVILQRETGETGRH